MIQDKDLRSLVEFSGTTKVLSVYLDTDLASKSKDAAKLMFRERVKELHQEGKDVQAVQRFLDFEYDWQSRGLAIFSAGQALWKVLPLPIAVRTQAVYADKPYVRILTDVLDQFGSYSVALVDQECLKLYAVARGRIGLELETVGTEVRSYKQGGWSVRGGQRSAITTHSGDNPALGNLKRAVEVVQAYCNETGCQQLVLGGSAEAVGQIKGLLPKALRDHVMGEFGADMEATPKEILNRSLDIAVQLDLAAEKKMVAQAVTAVAKGGAGVMGLADTLQMIHQGRVRMLLIEENYRASGHVCQHCGYVSTESIEQCPLCSYREFVETADVVNLAIYKAFGTGADVNIVRDNEQLNRAGGIAALLRY